MAKKDLLMGGMLKKIDDSHIFEKAETQIKNKINILPELKDLIPALGKEEYEQLEANMLAEGCREALILWQQQDNYVLVDGHNRYEICQKHGLDFRILVKDFPNLETVKSWMLNNQLGRRNLTIEQISYLRGKRYESEKLIQGGTGANQYNRLDDRSKYANFAQLTNEEQTIDEQSKYANFAQMHNTQERLAQEYSVSKRTIMNDAQFAKAIDKIGEINPTLRKEILSGATRINKSQIQEIAKMDTLPHLENIQDLENLFKIPKNPQEKRELSEKTKVEVLKEKLHKIFKSEKLSESEQEEVINYIEKLLKK